VYCSSIGETVYLINPVSCILNAFTLQYDRVRPSLSTQPLPVAESLASEVLSIPIGSHLDNNDVDTIVDVLNRFDPS
jgi:dTDP-4-amino-4,6-dideoxygalactose transaminase